MRPESARPDLEARLRELCDRLGVGGATTQDKIREAAHALGVPPPWGDLELAVELLETYASGSNTP